MSKGKMLRTERDGVLELVINRPDAANAIDPEMLNELHHAVIDLEQSTELRVMLIRSQGRFFSTGADVPSLVLAKEDEVPSRFRRTYRTGHFSFQKVGDAMETCEKPIVVAHHAMCLGGALELSLSCDFRLAGQSAGYNLSEVGIGLLPGSGGTSRLARLVGGHWARWLIMAGETVQADQALQMGLVHAVYPDDELEESAWKFCRKLAAMPPEAMAAAKMAIELGVDLDRIQARAVERMANSYLFLGDEHRAAMAAVMAKTSARKKS